MATPQRRKNEYITEELIAQYRTWEPGAAAMVYDLRLRMIESDHKARFTELGLIMVECVSREFWKLVTLSTGKKPESWTQWVQDAMPVAASTAFAAMDVAQKLKHIPAEERAEMPRGNLEVMAVMSTNLTGSATLKKAAKELKPEKFREMVEQRHPEQHIEAHKPMRLKPERSGRKVIDEAIRMAQVLEGATTREDAMEKICQLYIDDNRGRFRKYENQRATVQ